MPHLDLHVSCPVHDSFRVRQVAGLFDVPIEARASEHFQLDLPDLDDRWQLGLIVGPSASGKTTVARHWFGPRLYRRRPWPRDHAVIDAFGSLPIRSIIALLTAVGFSSPPGWIKPYHVLSTGEQFRCDLARALASSIASANPAPGAAPPLVVFDEFTSVVDRNVARVASAAIAKAIRQQTIPARFVAVTCHYDVAAWLQPDWVLDMANSQFTWRHLRRPDIVLAIHRCRRRAWQAFARHHYLSADLGHAARLFLALWQNVPVAFCATLALIGRKNRWRIHRIVTAPDYQGVGIGTALMESVARLHRDEGHRVNITASHPAIIAHCRRSPLWRTIAIKRLGSTTAEHAFSRYRGSPGRSVVSFEFEPP